MVDSRTKVLFFAEGATLAHVARPLLLASQLDTARFDVTLARPPAFQWLASGAPFRVVDLHCQDAAVFASRLEHGAPLYDYATLLRYVDDDLALIDAKRPDVIVGDFRLSLSISARLRSIPYITVCDAYWSPERPLHPPLPVLPFTRFAPIPLAKFVFGCVAPFAMRLHAVPLERLRKHFGLPSLGYDLRHCYTDADLRLFANFPALFPEVTPSPNADFIGPLAWSPEPADTSSFLADQEPLIYVTMGSSGDPRILETLVPILEQTGYPIVVATAGKPVSDKLASARTRVFDFVPGDQICRKAKLVVCNGGSPTTNQALANGVPVLGIARNMDQFLNMQTIEQFGAGMMVRGDRTDKRRLKDATSALLSNPLYTESAHLLARSAHGLDAGTRLTIAIYRLLSADNISRTK